MSAALARIPRPVAALLLALAIHLIGMALIRGFGTMFGIRAMLVLATLLAIAAIGQTLVIIIGGIDLSIPFVIGFANVTAAQLYGDGVPFAVVLPLVLLVAMAIGALNGLVSASLAIHPLIVTLGTGTALQGVGGHTPEQCVVAVIAVEPSAVDATGQDVIPGSAEDQRVTRVPNTGMDVVVAASGAGKGHRDTAITEQGEAGVRFGPDRGKHEFEADAGATLLPPAP